MKKQNLYTNRNKNKEQFTITADVTNILRMIQGCENIPRNNIQNWKNNTNHLTNVISHSNRKKNHINHNNTKFIKTITSKTKTLANHKPIMTEADIDKLFNQTKTQNEVSSGRKIKVEKKPKLKTQNAFLQPKNNHTKQFHKFQISNESDTQEDPLMERRYQVDFTQCVDFLKVDDDWDRLLSGLPIFVPKNIKKLNNKEFDELAIGELFQKGNGSTQPGENNVNLTHQFKKNFLVGKIIGEGAYASVRIAIYKPFNKKIAIKIYEKSKIKQIQRKKSIRREIKILQLLNHRNIVKIYDVIETNNHLNIIMEHLDGIPLNNYLKEQIGYKCSQRNCRKIIKPLIQALKYLHSKNIAHRDIKLQNIILDQQTLNPKLIDFGFSTCIQPLKKVKIFCGTPSYMAPQIIQKKQYRGQAADIWAMGVLFYVTLTGNFPFKGLTDQQLYRKINNAEYQKSDIPSKQAADLISKMLKISPQQRITAQQILYHPWISNNVKKNSKVQQFSNKKRTTLSSHKQREQSTGLNKTMVKKLTETCKQNLKVELRIAKHSPSNSKQTHNLVKKQSNLNQISNRKHIKTQKQIFNSQKKQVKIHSKVLDMLKIEMKRRQEQKNLQKVKQKDTSKGKSKKI